MQIDLHVGTRVRLRRTLLGLSQEKLGEALGLTFQQVQKYERGVNRIGASRLFDLARVLDVPIGFFFDDMPDSLGGPAAGFRARLAGFAEPQEGFEDDTLHRRETLKLVRAYYRITEPAVRKRVFDLIKALAPPGGPQTEDGGADRAELDEPALSMPPSSALGRPGSGANAT